MAYRIVELLVRVAAGKPPTNENKWGFYPFGKPAGVSTMAFKACPSPWFANALTFLYPYLTKPKAQWKELKKKYTHPPRKNLNFHVWGLVLGTGGGGSVEDP